MRSEVGTGITVNVRVTVRAMEVSDFPLSVFTGQSLNPGLIALRLPAMRDSSTTPDPLSPPTTAPSLRAVAWAGGALVAAIFIAYANSLGVPFLYDDHAAIIDNPSLENFRAALVPAKSATTTGRPALNLSFAFNRAFGGLQVRGYHVTNLLIHTAAALALFGLVRRTLLRPALRVRFERDATALALGVAALWALHPLQTEAVTYIAQRAESLMGMFYLLTLYAFLRSVDSPAPRAWLTLSFGACLLGMATKENMVSAPVLVLLFDRAFVAGTFAEAWRRRGRFYLALASTWLLLATLVVGTGGNRNGSAGFDVGIPWWNYGLTQFLALVTYLRLSFWPDPLVFDYGTFWVRYFSTVAVDALIVAALVGATLWAMWRKPAFGVLGALFFAILAPTSLVPGTTQMIVEHRMYLPLAALSTLIGLGVFRIAGPRGLIVLAIMAVALGGLTARRNYDYRSEFSLWDDAVAKRPTSSTAHFGRGVALEAMDRKPEAKAEYEAALHLRPNYFEAHSNLGRMLTDERRFDEAMTHLKAALDVLPDFPEANLNLGVVLDREGQSDAAIRRYERTLVLNPRLPEAHGALADVFLRRGQVPAALEHIHEALRLKPDFSAVRYNLASALLLSGRMTEAVAEFTSAEKLDPRDISSRITWSNTLLITGHVAEALAAYEATLALAPDDADVRYNHGNALAAAERFPEAIAEYNQALRLRPDFVEAHNNLGNAFTALDRDAEAIPHYEAALRLKPTHPSAHNNLGLALARTGRIAEAAMQFAEAVRLAPDNQEARANLAQAQAASGK